MTTTTHLSQMDSTVQPYMFEKIEHQRSCDNCFAPRILYISFSARLVQLDSTFIFRTLNTTSEAPYTPCKTDKTPDLANSDNLRQLQRAQPVSCELALHWFWSKDNYHEFVELPLICADAKLQTCTLERYLAQQWYPPLNYPFILQREVTKQHSTPHLQQALRNTFLGIGYRLCAQLRRSLMYKQVFHFYNHNLSKHTPAWAQLQIPAEQSQCSFDMQRHILSKSLHSDHLFALYQLANQLDDPPPTESAVPCSQQFNFDNYHFHLLRDL